MKTYESMKINENRWKCIENQWTCNENQWKSMKIHRKSMKIHRISMQIALQLNAVQCSWTQLNTAKCSEMYLKCRSVRWMQLNAAQRSSIHFTVARALARPLGERSEPLQLQGLCCTLFMQSAGRCHDMLGAAVQCWSLLRSVPKLIKFKARFPFFVRQVPKKRLECVHVCKVSHPKGPQLTC